MCCAVTHPSVRILPHHSFRDFAKGLARVRSVQRPQQYCSVSQFIDSPHPSWLALCCLLLCSAVPEQAGGPRSRRWRARRCKWRTCSSSRFSGAPLTKVHARCGCGSGPLVSCSCLAPPGRSALRRCSLLSCAPCARYNILFRSCFIIRYQTWATPSFSRLPGRRTSCSTRTPGGTQSRRTRCE
jgi:hypothetical protein